GFVARKLHQRRLRCVQRHPLAIVARVGALQRREAARPQPAGSQPKTEYLGVRGHVVPYDVVGPTHPESCTFTARIRGCSAVSTARCKFARTFRTYGEVVVEDVEAEVVVEDVEALRAIL